MVFLRLGRPVSRWDHTQLTRERRHSRPLCHTNEVGWSAEMEGCVWQCWYSLSEYGWAVQGWKDLTSRLCRRAKRPSTVWCVIRRDSGQLWRVSFRRASLVFWFTTLSVRNETRRPHCILKSERRIVQASHLSGSAGRSRRNRNRSCNLPPSNFNKSLWCPWTSRSNFTTDSFHSTACAPFSGIDGNWNMAPACSSQPAEPDCQALVHSSVEGKVGSSSKQALLGFISSSNDSLRWTEYPVLLSSLFFHLQ